jgi:hypothetical protein
MAGYQQANYPIGLGGYIGQPMGAQFGGPDPRLMPNVGFGNNPRPNGPSDPNEFWKGKDRGWLRFESLSDVQSKWKDIPQDQKNDIASRFSNPPEWMVGVSSPDRKLMEIPLPQSTQFADMAMKMQNDINARNGGMAGPQFGLGQIPNAGFYNDPQSKGPQFGGPQLGEHKLGYLGSENQLGMGSQFGGMGSQSASQIGAGQDELRRKMMEQMLNRESNKYF